MRVKSADTNIQRLSNRINYNYTYLPLLDSTFMERCFLFKT